MKKKISKVVLMMGVLCVGMAMLSRCHHKKVAEETPNVNAVEFEQMEVVEFDWGDADSAQ